MNSVELIGAKMKVPSLLVTTILVFFLASFFPVSAQEVYFSSPSKNIFCVYEPARAAHPPQASRSDAYIRCDIMQFTPTLTTVPPQTKDEIETLGKCTLKQMKAFVIEERGAKPSTYCPTDMPGPEQFVLEYDKSYTKGGLTCLSEMKGMTCQNSLGHVFSVQSIATRVLEDSNGVKEMTSRTAFFVMLGLLPSTLSFAQGTQNIPTIAGELSLIHSQDMKVIADDSVCAIKVANKVIYITKCEAENEPSVIGNYRRRSSDGDERQILVIQRNPGGNACDGGPIFVVELSKKYDAMVSDPLPFCGGLKPIIAQNANGLLITFPGGPTNRGGGRVPTERWQYQGGAFLKSR